MIRSRFNATEYRAWILSLLKINQPHKHIFDSANGVVRERWKITLYCSCGEKKQFPVRAALGW